MKTAIFPATGERITTALRLLFARFPLEQQEGRLREALASTERGTLRLDHLLVAESDGLPVGAALVMIQADGIALVWPPVVSCGATDVSSVEDLLMQEICHRMDSASARLGQSLLAPDDEAVAALLARHGFERAADMFFMARTIDAADQDPGPDRGHSVSTESYRPENAHRFARVIEQSYQGSLDCPFLNDVRTGEQALRSHQLSGEFHPEHWKLYRTSAGDAAVILLSDHPDQDAVELVYLGVAPSARGQGLGRRMLQEGLAAAAARGRVVMFLAVDCQNRFANAVYSEFNFAELARRRVMLRRSGQLARQ